MALVVVVGGGIASAEVASADTPGENVAGSLAGVPQSATVSDGVTVSGILLGVDGQPIVGLPVYIGDWDFEGCRYPDDTHQTQADGSFSFIAELPPWPERNVLCFGNGYYGGPTWNAQDAQFIDLSQDIDVGVVQRAPSVKVMMRWLVDRDFIGLVNEDSTTQAHAINLDTGSVYRGGFAGWEGDGVWETLELPLGRYRFAVRTLWWDPQTWVYYPGTMSPEEAEIVDVHEDMTLPQEVQANPGIVKVGESPWGSQLEFSWDSGPESDWWIESCTTDWSVNYVHEQYFDPEPNQWVLPIGSYRLAVHRDGELWDWTPCLQIEPNGVYETEWTQRARAIPPRAVNAFVADDRPDGKPSRRVSVEVVPGVINTFLPTDMYRVDLIREDSGQSVANTWAYLDEDFQSPFTVELDTDMPAGRYAASVTSMVRVEGRLLSSDPVRSGIFEVHDLAPSPAPSPSAFPSPPVSPTPTPSASPSPTASPTPTAGPTSSPMPSPTDTASPSPVPSSLPSTTPEAPQQTPISGAGNGSASSGGSRGALAETGAAAPPLALPISALAAVMAAGLLRLVRRGPLKRRI
ncbi:hypothetical protein AB0O90_15285 [Microbacterium testaceum]|uniref:hypothetical protein n=1 Tax=Microbacterium testaceum TaxID=2033 RepID=UPI003439DFAC